MNIAVEEKEEKMRLIDADRLIALLNKKYGGDDINESVLYLVGVISGAPTVDAVSLEDYRSMEQTVNKLTKAISENHIKHGHWISCDNDNDAPYKCSVCGGIKPSKNGEWLDFCEVVWCKKPYCAMCGAKMDEVKDEQ